MTSIPSRPPPARRGRLLPVVVVAGLLLVSIVVWDIVRAASLFLVWTWVLGTLLLRLLLPGGSGEGLRGWAGATVAGLAGGIMTWLLMAVLGIPLTRWSVGPVMVLQLAVLALGTGWRPAQLRSGVTEVTRRVRDLDPRRLQGPALALAAAAGLVALVAAAAHGLPTTTTANPSTSMAFGRPTDGQEVVSGARAGSVSTLWVRVDRAAGDTSTYSVDVTLTGRPAWTAARLAPASTLTPVTIPVRFPMPGGCRYEVRGMLTPAGQSAPLYTILAYGGRTTAKQCAAQAAPARPTTTTRTPGSKG